MFVPSFVIHLAVGRFPKLETGMNLVYTGILDPGMFKKKKPDGNHSETFVSGIFVFSTFLGQDSQIVKLCTLSSSSSTNKHTVNFLKRMALFPMSDRRPCISTVLIQWSWDSTCKKIAACVGRSKRCGLFLSLGRLSRRKAECLSHPVLAGLHDDLRDEEARCLRLRGCDDRIVVVSRLVD